LILYKFMVSCLKHFCCAAVTVGIGAPTAHQNPSSCMCCIAPPCCGYCQLCMDLLNTAFTSVEMRRQEVC
jgi:hypothetical protein